MDFSEYTSQNSKDVLAMLKTSEAGLSKKESLLHQKDIGLNEIKTKNINALSLLARQFKSPFCYLLLFAALLSVIMGRFVDSIAVLVFIFINVAIGFFQEYRAERSVALLQKFVPQKVKILRDSKEEIIDAKFLVPGDIVLLEAGDLSPADMRVIAEQNFFVDESVLTGESTPVFKISDALRKESGLPGEKEIYRAKNIIFSGTSAVSGKAAAVVVATGKDTVLGNIAKTVSGIRRESSYEKSILYFCKLILRIVVVTIVLIFAANIFIKGIGSALELILFSVALIVSILPEALPAVVTFALSEGSLELAKRKVVVKRLSAIEDLGNIEVLCTDKTGTLTLNKLSLEQTVSSDKKKLLLYGILSSGADKINDKILNPFDSALFERVSEEVLRDSKKFKIIAEAPFDSYRMRSAFLVESSRSERIIIVKGAPETILKNCIKSGGNFNKKEILEDVEREGMEGKRVLALAYKKVEKEKNNIEISDEKHLTFLGYFVFEDPLKSTAKEAIELSKKLGIQIKIITGDSKEVSGFVAKKIGLAFSDQDFISGFELEKMPIDDFDFACNERSVFARISPEIKHKIIKSLQKKYEVGFMGEGINDAPALKTADVGIAVVEASDVAREAADVVLLQKDLRVVVNGIKDGRAIFSNINKYIKCALANNFGNFYSIAVISLFINFLPMLPVQILLGNILSDFPLISVATDSVDIEELKKPKAYELHNVLPLIVTLGLVSTLFDFIFYSVIHKNQPAVIQTLWFIETIFTEIFLIFIVRTRGKFWKAKRPGILLLSLSAIDGIIILALPFLKIGQTWFHFVTPPIIPLIIVFLIVGAYLVMSETVKLIYFHYFKPPIQAG